jgi:hypothetical protein
MDEVVYCDCGLKPAPQTRRGSFAEVQRHAWDAHGMSLSHADALLVAFHAELVPGGAADDVPRRNRERGRSESAVDPARSAAGAQCGLEPAAVLEADSSGKE